MSSGGWQSGSTSSDYSQFCHNSWSQLRPCRWVSLHQGRSSLQIPAAGFGVPQPPSGFPHSSVGKESACNTGDPGSIPGLGRSPGEGHGNPLQYPCLENPKDRGAWQATVHGVARLGHDLATKPPPTPLRCSNSLEWFTELRKGSTYSYNLITKDPGWEQPCEDTHRVGRWTSTPLIMGSDTSSSRAWTSTHIRAASGVQSFYWGFTALGIYSTPSPLPCHPERWEAGLLSLLAHPESSHWHRLRCGSRTTRSNKDAPSIRKFQEFRSSVPVIWGKTR